MTVTFFIYKTNCETYIVHFVDFVSQYNMLNLILHLFNFFFYVYKFKK